MSFELKFFVCRHVSIWGFQNPVCLSICPYPEKRNYPGFVNISLTLIIDTSMERSSRVLHHGNTKIWFFFFFKVWNLNFDEELKLPISPTLVIDTSMEKSSQVLRHGYPKIWFFFQKSSKLNFDLCWRAEIALASSISVLHW